jgi:hypothetical protein
MGKPFKWSIQIVIQKEGLLMPEWAVTLIIVLGVALMITLLLIAYSVVNRKLNPKSTTRTPTMRNIHGDDTPEKVTGNTELQRELIPLDEVKMKIKAFCEDPDNTATIIRVIRIYLGDADDELEKESRLKWDLECAQRKSNNQKRDRNNDMFEELIWNRLR